MSRRRAAQYLHLEAESSNEKYDSEEESEDLDNFVEPATVPRAKSFTQLTRELEERYGDDNGEDSGDEEVVEMVSQAQLVPTARSPLLFLVRCKFGHERETAQRVFEKAAASEISSVMQKEGLRGYIYVEAFRKQAVEDALAGVRGISRRIGVVPLREMIEAVSQRHTATGGEFARIKSGKYKGDLVHVLEDFGDTVMVRAVPRIGDVRRRFDPAEFRGEVTAKEAGFIFRRDFYRDGYLEKMMLRTNLDFDVEPTFAELDELQLRKRVEVNGRVRVSKGDLKSIVGTVESVHGNMAVVRSEGRRIEISTENLERVVEPGQEVSYRGENGTVLAVNGASVVLGMDGFSREVVCGVSEIKPAVFERQTSIVRNERLKTRRDAMVNKEVRIAGGEFKGLQGTVRDASQDRCIVWLRSSRREVTVDRALLAEVGTARQPVAETGGQTPGFRTPGFRTPSFRTPSAHAHSTEERAEDAGIGWLASEYDGAMVVAKGAAHVISDMENGVFKTRTGELLLPHEIKYSEPEKYDRVVVMEGPEQGTQGMVITISGEGRCIVRDSSGRQLNVELSQLARKEN